MGEITNTDDWLAAFPRDATEQEVRELEVRLARAEHQLLRAQQKVTAIRARLIPRRQALALWRAVQEHTDEAAGSDASRMLVTVDDTSVWPSASLAASLLGMQWASNARPTLRAGIRIVLDEAGGQPLKLSDLRDRLVAKGWISDDEKGVHRVQMMASDMVRKRQLARPSLGYYMLRPDESEEPEEDGP